MPSLKPSFTGLQIIKQTRKEKGWTIDDPRWLEAASQILQPERNWQMAEVFATGVSLPTWKRFLKGDAIDASVFKAFCQVLELDWQNLVERLQNTSVPGVNQIPNYPHFFGRRYELMTLTQAIESGISLLTITGMGGIGKTALAVKLIEACRSNFQQILWFSYHLNLPTINSLLVLPPNSLVVFDGWDAILGGDRAGQYRLGYENYAEFLRSLVQTTHSSCVILTTREEPQGLNALTSSNAVIFKLNGLMEGAVELLAHHQLIFDAELWVTLTNQYGGNPLFLNMVASLIHELFGSDVGEFLASKTLVTGEFEFLVTQWLAYISPIEKILLKCLASHAQGLTREQIKLQLQHISTGDILSALLSLKRRSLLETLGSGVSERFVLQPVILKCVQRLFGCN